MVQKRNKHRNTKTKSKSVLNGRLWIGLGFILGALLTAGAFILFNGKLRSVMAHAVYRDCSNNLTNQIPIRDLKQLLLLSPDELGNIDVALMNLICVKGLHGSENLDIDECLRTLDQWAQTAKDDTQKRMQAFYADPAKYDNSVNLFKLANMILTLKNIIGVDYNIEIMQSTDFIDSRDFFLHGCLTGKKEGGCISIPTLCVAVGRRCGYPLKLALTREHVFFRWDDGMEIFNMEACCPGCDTHPDEYYLKWPNKLNDVDVKLNGYLRSLTPAEELGLFLEARGHCLYDNGAIDEAQIMYAYAYKLMPDSLDRLSHIHKAVNNELKKFQKINTEENTKKKSR